MVRFGMRQTPLFRLANVLDVSVAPVEDILGFFLWTDIVGYSRPSLYRYAQSCDPLIEEGQAAEENVRDRRYEKDRINNINVNIASVVG